MISTSFLVLGLSDFTITRNLGLMTSGIMALCLLADVTLLAVLLLRMPPEAHAHKAPGVAATR
jgi:predicted RND superfamily exporter protein